MSMAKKKNELVPTESLQGEPQIDEAKLFERVSAIIRTENIAPKYK